MIKKIIDFLLSFIFPIECLGCNKENTYFCSGCRQTIPMKNKIEPFEHPLTYLDGVFSAIDYNNKFLRQAIHYFKFRFIKELADPLSQFLIDYYKNTLQHHLKKEEYIIIPVPLNKKRLLERGFNQSELIARYFLVQFNFKLITKAVIRYKNTPHQVGLSKKQRIINVKNSFKIAQPNRIKNKQIILIDDVVTTGSTLEEIAKALKKSGAKKVWALTIAKD